MEKLNISVSSQNISEPAHSGDVGHDLIAVGSPYFCGKPMYEGEEYFSVLRYIEYETMVAIAPPEGTYTLVYPRSSISKTNLVLANSVGVIDNGYRNTIKLRFKYIFQPEDFEIIKGKIYMRVNHDRIYKAGERIGQAVFVQSLDTKLFPTNIRDVTSRGKGGFGSTGS